MHEYHNCLKPVLTVTTTLVNKNIIIKINEICDAAYLYEYLIVDEGILFIEQKGNPIAVTIKTNK